MTWFLPPHPGVQSGQSDMDRPLRTAEWYPAAAVVLHVTAYRDGGARVETYGFRRGDMRYAPRRVGDYRLDHVTRAGLRWCVLHAALQLYLEELGG